MGAARAAALGVALLGLGPAASAGRAGAVDLAGTWHVVVHYTDEGTAHPERMHWEDRIWIFERTGERIRWIEYPIVVFEDQSGRFEVRGTGRPHRVLHAWEPNEGQLRNILDGLEVNPRGSKAKSLRGSDANGWRSISRSMSASASVISYQEIWSIEGLPERPVFTRDDMLGAARTETLEGRPRYATLEIAAEGNVVRGSYERDGTRHGTFRMLRGGAVRDVEGDGRSPNEKRRDAILEEVRREYRSRGGGSDPALGEGSGDPEGPAH